MHWWLLTLQTYISTIFIDLKIATNAIDCTCNGMDSAKIGKEKKLCLMSGNNNIRINIGHYLDQWWRKIANRLRFINEFLAVSILPESLPNCTLTTFDSKIICFTRVISLQGRQKPPPSCHAKFNENIIIFFSHNLLTCKFVNFLFAIRLSSDFLRGSNIYILWVNLIKFVVLFHCSS